MGRRDTGWLKVYYRVIDDKKVMSLEPALRWFWIELLCIAGEHDDDGVLPDLSAIGFRLYRSLSPPDRLQIDIDVLVDRKLIDKEKGGSSGFRLRIHDWDDWQPKSGASTERVKRFRERSSNTSETRSSRAPAKTDYRQDKTDRRDAHAREPASPDFSTSSQSTEQKTVLRPIDDEPGFQANNVKVDEMTRLADFWIDRIITSYEKSFEKTVSRPKVEAMWAQLSRPRQMATLEGYLVWQMETTRSGEPVDPKFVKGLDKLLEEGTLGRKKIVSPGVDRFGKPLADIRPEILASWLGGELYRGVL